MKIVFIQPPWAQVYGSYRSAAKIGNAYPPLGLCYLAQMALVLGHEAQIIDAEAQNLTFTQLIAKVAEFFPDIVAVTSTTPIFHITKDLVRQLKTKTKATFILGGSHVTVMPYQAMADVPEAMAVPKILQSHTCHRPKTCSRCQSGPKVPT